MLLLAFEDLAEKVAAHKVAHGFTVGDSVTQKGQGLHFEREIGLEDFLYRFANTQAPERLKVGQSVEEQDAVCQQVGVLHLVDRFVAFVLCQLLDAPVGEHAIMQPVLVDRGQLVEQRLVKVFDDGGVALHGVDPLQMFSGFYASKLP